MYINDKLMGQLQGLNDVLEIIGKHKPLANLRSGDLNGILATMIDSRMLGSGAYGTCIRLSDDTVMKLSFCPIDAYPAFVRWCLNQRSQTHLPEFLEVIDFGQLFVTVMPHYGRFDSWHAWQEHTGDAAEDMVGNLKLDAGDICQLDLHSGNWMWRAGEGSELVLTDGLSYYLAALDGANSPRVVDQAEDARRRWPSSRIKQVSKPNFAVSFLTERDLTAAGVRLGAFA
jgi:hypothetical protein